ncbi:Gfo/Idh/MocA family oxidoreductase [bacterium]|nr:Gfo/Idh/MocA family oxidoreductase [bacterium]
MTDQTVPCFREDEKSKVTDPGPAPVSRRRFLKTAVVSGLSITAGGLLSGCASQRWIRDANESVRIGIAGLRIKGAQHIDIFRTLKNVRVAALCDVDADILAREARRCADSGMPVDTYRDFRKMIERKDIDAVVISSPNHWHALMGVWACQAGKDVYVEKPVSHNVREGRRLVEAARKYGRVVQAGVQKRSDTGLVEAFDYIRQGHIGQIRLARGLCYKRRKSIGLAGGPQPVPAQIDYDLWTGPAEMGPLMRKQLHYDWHWVWNTGNGDLGNQGIHEVDLCRWALGESGLPGSVMSYGGRFGYSDDGETPNTQIIVFDYKSAPLLFEVRGLPRSSGIEAMDAFRGIRIGVVIHCEHGYFAGGDGGGWIYDTDGRKMKQFVGTGGVREHAENFIRAVRDRNPAVLTGNIEEGHVSSALCHLGNISWRLGTWSGFDAAEKAERISDWRADAFHRFSEHLEKNGTRRNKEQVCMGPCLEILTEAESFRSAESFDMGHRANQLLDRKYRKPFLMPDPV